MRRFSRSITSKAAGATLALAAMTLLLGSCKGRTNNDVEATGETVDVVIPEIDEAAEPQQGAQPVQAQAPGADTAPQADETQSTSSSDSLHQTPLQFQNY